MNDMIEKFDAVIVNIQYDSEKKSTEYTCEYEKNGRKQTAVFNGSSSMIIDEGSHVEITVENGKVIATNMSKITGTNSIFMLICLLGFIAAVILLFVWFVKTRYIGVRIGIGIFAAAVYILTHIPFGSRKENK